MIHRRLAWSLMMTAGATLFGCPSPTAESTRPAVVEPPTDAGRDAPSLPAVVWTPCKLRTAAAEPAECAQIMVPLRWDADDGRAISVAVTRFHPPGGPSEGQLWALQGGPGASSPDLDGMGPYLARLGVKLDLYLVDQRGTGRSARLGCPDQESRASEGGFAITAAEWPACIASLRAAWPDGGLNGFSVTNTARDVGEIIRAVRRPDEKVFVYGVSYGTYLVNRYLQMYPNQPTGVILDSICGPDACRSSRADARFDAAAKLYFQACGADAFCASKLGADPWSRLGTVLGALDAGSCPAATRAGLTRERLRGAFAQLLYSWDRRALVPALVRRLERCGAQDEPVFRYFGNLLGQPTTAASLAGFSTVLANHVALSELWDEPAPSAESLEEEDARHYVSNGIGPKLARLYDAWPRVAHDDHWGRWAESRAAILMMNGTLDPATPLEMQGGARAAFPGTSTFVALPGAPHATLLESPVADAGKPPCGTSLLVSFLTRGDGTVDTTCAAEMAPLTFDRSRATADFFGTSDLWGD